MQLTISNTFKYFNFKMSNMIKVKEYLNFRFPVYCLLLIAICLFPSSSKAGGFQINTMGAKALGMGGAFTGVANDASTIYFNPAGMSDIRWQHELYTGVSLIFPQVSVQTAANGNINQ